MMKLSRIVASLTVGALLSVGLAVPAHAVPPQPICYGGPGPTWDITYKGVRVHLAVYCQWLDAGRSWYFGHARMTMQRDGNLVIYDQNNRARWATGTYGSGATQLVFQQDGNLVLYTAGYARAVWASGTRFRCRNAGVYTETLGMQSDSNFVIYCRYKTDGSDMYPVWSTRTVF
jgi:hypothetical protein